MKYNRLSRRNFLQTAAGGLIAFPFLPSLFSKADADTILVPKKFVSARNPNGYYMRQLFPTAEAATKIANDVYVTDLRATAGQDISQLLTSARFETVRSKMNLLRGLDPVGNAGHNSSFMLGGYYFDSSASAPTGKTIDAVLSRSSKVYATEPQMRLLSLKPGGGTSSSGGGGISFDVSGNGFAALPTFANENAVFQALFGATGASQSAAALAHSANQTKVVDQVFKDYLAVKQSRFISSVDSRRLEQHMALLSDLQNRLKGSPSGSSCVAPTLGVSNSGTYNPWNIDIGYKNHIDLIVAAMACGLTNIATLNMESNGFFDANYSHDPVSHCGDQVGQLDLAAAALKINGFYADKISYLVKQMDSVLEANGKTMLDNSLVFWSSEMSNARIHCYDSSQAVLFGGLQGYFKTGLYVDYRQKPLTYKFSGYADWDANGRVYNQLLVTILQGMGLSPEEYELAGNPGFGNYIPRGNSYSVDWSVIYAGYLSTAMRRAPLPAIT